MRRFYLIAVCVLAVVIALPAAYYYLLRPAPDDQLDNTLRAMGFFPINPPNNLMRLGSLYYVDRTVTYFRTVCSADPKEVRPLITSSPSTRTVAHQLASGSFKAGADLTGAGPASGSGGVNEKYLSRVRFSLSHVQLYEIDLSINHKIMQRLMAQKDCSDAIDEVYRAGGYVCQGQTLLEADASFDLNINKANDGDLQAKVAEASARDALKTAVSANSNVKLVERSGKLVTGSALEYGVAMGPLCLTPEHARFARTLPKTAVGRFWNYVKFNLVEPLLPET